MMPLPLAADEVSLSENGFGTFEEAGGADINFTVNPDGSLSGLFSNSPVTSGSLSWELPPGFFGPQGASPGLDFPALPPGSTINSATFSFNVTEGLNYLTGDNINDNIAGSLALQSVSLGGACGLKAWSVPFPPGNTVSFTPCSTGEQFYEPDFSGGGNASAAAVIPSQPGGYIGGLDVAVSANYTITVNYSTTPEPRTYGFLVGLSLVGLFAVRRRSRPEERACHCLPAS